MEEFGWPPGLCLLSFPALADRIELSASTFSLVAGDSADTTWALLEFDLSGLPEDVRIDECLVEGVLSGAANDGSARFAIYAVTSGWDQESVASGSERVVKESEPIATWDISSLDHERNGSFVRFDLTRLAQAWHLGGRTNHGLLVEGVGISSEDFATGLAEFTAILLTGR